MRFRPFLFLLMFGAAAPLALSGCNGKPENSPVLRKKFAEMDQAIKSIEEMHSEMQFLTAEVRRQNEEMKELRALSPGLDGAAPALEKLDAIEQRLSRVENMAKDAVMANVTRPTETATPASREVAMNVPPTTKPADLESKGLAVPTKPAPTKPEVAVQQETKQESKPAATTAAPKETRKEEKPATNPNAALKPANKPSAVSTVSNDKSTVRKRGGYHVIEAGDSIAAIAEKYGVTVDAIQKANRLPAGSRLAKGQRLYIPAG